MIYPHGIKILGASIMTAFPTVFRSPHPPSNPLSNPDQGSSEHSIHPIQINNLTVTYGLYDALRDINLTIQPGRLTGITGPNGAGKSTLLKAVLGLVPSQKGTIYFGCHPLIKCQERVAYVPQRTLVDWSYPATVWDVVMMGRVQKTGLFHPFSALSRQVGMAALNRVEMGTYRNRPIGNLSGGQQQRVFLARALAQEADIFCLDEPMASIDQMTQSVIFTILRELANRGKIVMVVHHDLGESIHYFDDLILLNQVVITAGDRSSVLTRDNMATAYGVSQPALTHPVTSSGSGG